ncbi:MAG: metallophosphoesterase [Actinomycetota bacterium]
MRVPDIAVEIAGQVGPTRGLRILHVSDLHNRRAGFRLVRELARAIAPAAVVNTGDLSGLGSYAEGLWIAWYCDLPAPLVFAQGNHDSSGIGAQLRRVGACVLDASICRTDGLAFWGYPDPNRTRLRQREKYQGALCERSRIRLWPPDIQGPVVGAVHHELMASSPAPNFPLVLTGHVHSQRVHRRGPTLYVRCGSTGGGGPFGGPLEAAIIDVDPSSLHPQAVWLVQVQRAEVIVRHVDPD